MARSGRGSQSPTKGKATQRPSTPSSSAADSAGGCFVPVEDIQAVVGKKWKRAARRPALTGRTFTLVTPDEQFFYKRNKKQPAPSLTPFASSPRILAAAITATASEDPHDEVADFHDLTSHVHVTLGDAVEEKLRRATKLHEKKQRQWHRWAGQVIPGMLSSYMTICRETLSLREVVAMKPLPPCKKCTVVSDWPVVLVQTQRRLLSARFRPATLLTEDVGLVKIVLKKCSCRSIPMRLLQLGFFPCSPVLPTLAVDLNMLEFVKELFMRMPPNVTAWCATLEHFLEKRQYTLTTRVSSARTR